MRRHLVFLLVLLSGCASIRAREEADPGHGAYTAVLDIVGLATQAACASPEIVGRVAASVAKEHLK